MTAEDNAHPSIPFILKTVDGGITWKRQTIPNGHAMDDIFFIDNNVGYTCGGGGNFSSVGSVLSTNDGGEHWNVVYEAPQFLYSLKVVGTQHIWAVGARGTIVNSTNGGVTWVKQNVNTTAWINDIDMMDSEIGIAIGRDSLVFLTKDGGTTWSHRPSAGGGSVHMISAKEAWISAYHAMLLHTLDSGKTWLTQHRTP